MYPILLKIGSIEIQSYYVLWSAALIAAMLWTNRRVDRSGLPAGDVSSVISCAFIGMILGARGFLYVSDWRLYYENPSLFFDFNNFAQGGISEVGAIITAIAVAFAACAAKKVSFWRLSDIASPAVLLTIAVGRWGCWLNGCCGGVHGHPTQLYYSFSAAIILSIVLSLENYNRRNGKIFKYGIVSPIGLGLYSVSRLVIDRYRLTAGTGAMEMSDGALAVCAGLSLVWAAVSAKNVLRSSRR